MHLPSASAHFYFRDDARFCHPFTRLHIRPVVFGDSSSKNITLLISESESLFTRGSRSVISLFITNHDLHFLERIMKSNLCSEFLAIQISPIGNVILFNSNIHTHLNSIILCNAGIRVLYCKLRNFRYRDAIHFFRQLAVGSVKRRGSHLSCTTCNLLGKIQVGHLELYARIFARLLYTQIV